MYRVMIVEDEMFVRLGLKNLIPWARYQMEVAADFSNGRSALEYFFREKPEVVITDIRMPGMDGMDLIRRIRAVSADTVLILLTCIEDFGMAQEAIRLEALGYISKLSMKEDEMERIVAQAKIRLDAVHGRDFERVKPSDRRAIVQNVLKKAVFGNLYREEELLSYCSTLPVRISEYGLTLCILDMGRMEGLKKKFGDDRDYLIPFALMNLAEETVGRICLGEMLTVSAQRYLLFLSFQSERPDADYGGLIEEALDQVQYSLKIYFNISAFMGLSSCGGTLTDLSKKYSEAACAMESRFLFPGITDRCRHGDVRSADYYMEQIEALLNGEAGQRLAFEQRSELRARAEALALQPAGLEKRTAGLLCDFLQLVIEGCDLGEKQKQSFLREAYPDLRRCADMSAAREYCLHIWETVKETGGYRKGTGPEIRKALAIIGAEYGQELSLNALAGRIGLSPAYFSALFKKEMKVNYVEYLCGLRIDRAKELLLRTDESVYVISAQAGFKNTAYFSRVFRRVTGESPGEYRKNRTLEESL